MTMTLDAIRDAIRSRCLAMHHRRGASASDILAALAEEISHLRQGEFEAFGPADTTPALVGEIRTALIEGDDYEALSRLAARAADALEGGTDAG